MCGALAFRWCAHGARTAKLLRTWPCAEHWLPNGLAACGFTLRQWPRRLRHGSAAQGGAMALPMAGCAAVLQGAPRARPTGRPVPRTWASAPQKKRAARGMACEREVLRTGPFPCRRQRNGLRKGCASHRAFPLPAAAKWPVKGMCFAQGLSPAGGTPRGRPANWMANFFFRPLKNLATGEEKYATILATERRIMPSIGEGMLCHGC